jgi:hypothetical protein
MQPDRDEQPATPGGVSHLLDYTNLANLGTDALTQVLTRIGRNRTAVSELGGRVAAVLNTRDNITLRDLEAATDISRSTLSRWIASCRVSAA